MHRPLSVTGYHLGAKVSHVGEASGLFHVGFSYSSCFGVIRENFLELGLHRKTERSLLWLLHERLLRGDPAFY